MDKTNDLQIIRMKRYRMLVLIAIILAGFLTQFHRASSGSIRGDLAETFLMNATQFGTFSSMYFYPYMLMQLPIGILADKIGPRKLIISGCFTAALGTLIFSLAQSFAILCIGRLLVGIGVSAPIICKDKLMVEWYAPNRIVTMGGISSFFQNMGGVCAQAPLSFIVGIFAWRATFIGLAVFSALVGVFAFIFVRNKPSDLGFVSEIELQGFVKPERPRARIIPALKNLITNRYTWPLLFIMPVEMGAYTMFSGTWGVSYFKEVFGYSATEATTYTTLIMVGWCVSILFVCTISDRIGKRKGPIIILCSIATLVWGIMTLGSGLIKGAAPCAVLAVLFGFTGSLTPLLFAVAREVNDPAMVGTTLGVVNMIGMGAGAVFPVICGSIIDKYTALGYEGAGLYNKAFMFIFILLVIAEAVTILFIKETNCRNIHLKKA